MKPGLAKGGEARDVKESHRQQDEGQCDDEHAPRQPEAAEPARPDRCARSRRKGRELTSPASFARSAVEPADPASLGLHPEIIFYIGLNNIRKIRFRTKAETFSPGPGRTPAAIRRRCARSSRRAPGGSDASPRRRRPASAPRSARRPSPKRRAGSASAGSPSCDVSSSAARSRKPTAERGEACQWRTSSPTGRIASLPASGSRMMPKRSPEAALFGAPGRTQIVGSRNPIPSKKPRRE